MKDSADDIDDLIGKLLAGEASAPDEAIIESWVKESEANRKYFEQVKAIFEKAAAPSIRLQFDTDAAWIKVRNKLKDDSRTEMWPNTQRVWKIAASIALLVSIGYTIYWVSSPTIDTRAFTSTKEAVQDTLPDGSTAFLNRKSQIQYEYNSREKTRKVKLKGEAFFEVKHEEEKPFIIEAEQVLIRDVGTTFNVKAFAESNTVEVVVVEGEVQFYTLIDSGLNLIAGERGYYDKTLKKFSKQIKLDTNSLSYKTKVFSFNNTDLGSVVDKLNEVYDSKIVLANGSLRDCHLTVNFADDKFDTIIDVLAETLNLTVTRNGDEVKLDGKGCN